MRILGYLLVWALFGCSGFHTTSPTDVNSLNLPGSASTSALVQSAGGSSAAVAGLSQSSASPVNSNSSSGSATASAAPGVPVPVSSNATSALFGAFQLQANQSLSWGGLMLLMQSQGNLVLYAGQTVLWASGSSGPNGADCGGLCYASFQTAGNLVLYTNSGSSYFASSGEAASGYLLKLSILAPYISIVNSKHLTVWTPTTGQIAPSIDFWEVVTAFAYRHPQEVKKLTFSNAAVFPGDHTERMAQGRLIDRYGVDSLRFIDDVIEPFNGGVAYAGTVQILPWGSTYWWTTPYQLSARYLKISDAGTGYLTSIITNLQNIESGVIVPSDGSVNNIHEYVDGFGVMDFGGSIGSRWYVQFSQQPIAINGVYPAGDSTVNEFSIFDLGPADGVYDPEFGHIGYEQGNTGTPGGNTQFWGSVVPGTPASSFFGVYSYGSPTVQGFGPFTLSSGQSLQVGNMTLTMQSAGNLVLTNGSEVVWAVGGADGTGINCQGQCRAYFQSAGNLVLYDAANHPYWYNSTSTASGYRLQLSTGYPYISIVRADSSIEWQGRPWLTGTEYQQLCAGSPATWCSWLNPGQAN